MLKSESTASNVFQHFQGSEDDLFSSRCAMKIISYNDKSFIARRAGMASPYRLRELDEVLGDLHHVEEAEGCCLALIGKIPVLLPLELAGKLEGLVGHRVGVLRLSGFHVRDLEVEEHAIR